MSTNNLVLKDSYGKGKRGRARLFFQFYSYCNVVVSLIYLMRELLINVELCDRNASLQVTARSKTTEEVVKKQ